MVFGHTDDAIQLSVEVEGKDDPFFPGDKVKATITLTTKKGGEVKKLHAGLQFHSKRQSARKSGGKDGEEATSHKWAETDEWVAEDNLLGEADLARGLSDTYHLQWEIPGDAAPSYRGDIIEHIYKVKVELERVEGKDPKEEVELQVVQPAPGKELEPGSYGIGKNEHDARLQFELPKLEFVDGEAVTGRLMVEPHVDIEAQSVKLEMCRVETITEGDTPNRKEHVAQTHGIAGITILKSGETTNYDFTFPVATDGCPSFKHGDAEGSWRLRAIISRPLAINCEVEQKLYLYAAYKQG